MGEEIRTQSDVFLHGEGDAWFLRNREQIESLAGQTIDVDFICNSITPFRSTIRNILEIGCGSGDKLIRLAQFFDASGSGIDPSAVAINYAREASKLKSSQVVFEVGLATDLPYENEVFDFVFFGFCLYLIPPAETYKAIMEANRVLKNGGFLAILDFDHGGLKVNAYKHAPGVFSYKNDYSAIFLSSNFYSRVSKWSFSLNGDHFVEERDDRISVEVLFKEVL